MQTNISGVLISVLLISFFAAVALLPLWGAIWTFSKAKKRNAPNAKKAALFSLFCMLLAAASWVLNMGWIRFSMTILFIPFLHAIVFSVTNLFAASYVDESRRMRLLNILFCITYLLSYLFFPDRGDIGGLYFFFSLIRNNTLASIAMRITYIAFFAHVALLILQIIQIVKIKKKRLISQESD